MSSVDEVPLTEVEDVGVTLDSIAGFFQTDLGGCGMVDGDDVVVDGCDVDTMIQSGIKSNDDIRRD